jgi:hypothetical protein
MNVKLLNLVIKMLFVMTLKGHMDVNVKAGMMEMVLIVKVGLKNWSF